MEEEEEKREFYNRNGGHIPESALCMICFKPFCDIRCRGHCMRTFHSNCIRDKKGNNRYWKCPLCANKEIEKYSKMLKHMKSECTDKCEVPGSGFSQLVLLDTTIPHKKRDVMSFRVKCSECDKKTRGQLVRCVTCGSMYHRGCLPVNCITLSSRFIMYVIIRFLINVVALLIFRVESMDLYRIDNSNDHLSKSLHEQFDKLKGIISTTGRGSHLMRKRGRGRGNGGNRGGRANNHFSHIIASDPTLTKNHGELIECARCGKFRRYPSYIDKSRLPKPWFCEYNTWDKHLASCSAENSEDQFSKKEDINIHMRAKLTTPAIWGGESIKTNTKFVPSSLNSVGLINYIYFSKFAVKAVNRVNFLGFVSSSYAFNHSLATSEDVVMALCDNEPISKMALSTYEYFRGTTSCTVKMIINTTNFYKSIFNEEKGLLLKCIRYMLEKNLIVLTADKYLTEDSVFLFNDTPKDKNVTVKDLRLRKIYHGT